MPLARDSRQERKIKAVLRAEFSLKQRLERIDHEEDVVMPMIEALKSGKAVYNIPAGAVFDIHITQVHENPTQLPPADDRE